jgi:hypothetical protein
MRFLLSIKDSVFDYILIYFPNDVWRASLVRKRSLRKVTQLGGKFIMQLLVSLFLNIIMLLSMGITSPALAFSIGLSIISECYFKELRIGKQLLLIRQERARCSDFVDLLTISDKDLWRFPNSSIGILIFIPSMLLCLATVDISSDELGYSAGVAFLIITLCFATVLWWTAKKSNILVSSTYFENMLILDITDRKIRISFNNFFVPSFSWTSGESSLVSSQSRTLNSANSPRASDIEISQIIQATGKDTIIDKDLSTRNPINS